MSQHTAKSWTVEHKPGRKTSSGMACDTGCNITAHDGQTTVTLCPLHAQAPAMREALSDLLRVIDRDDPWVRVTTYNPTHEASIRAKRERARAAIRAANGG